MDHLHVGRDADRWDYGSSPVNANHRTGWEAHSARRGGRDIAGATGWE